MSFCNIVFRFQFKDEELRGPNGKLQNPMELETHDFGNTDYRLNCRQHINVESTYREEDYTTRLDLERVTDEQKQKANEVWHVGDKLSS